MDSHRGGGGGGDGQDKYQMSHLVTRCRGSSEKIIKKNIVQKLFPIIHSSLGGLFVQSFFSLHLQMLCKKRAAGEWCWELPKPSAFPQQ